MYLRLCFDGLREIDNIYSREAQATNILIACSRVWLMVLMRSSSSRDCYIPLRGPEAAISLMPTIGA